MQLKQQVGHKRCYFGIGMREKDHEVQSTWGLCEHGYGLRSSCQDKVGDGYDDYDYKVVW